MKFWKIAFYSLGIIPWGFIISLFAFYFNAALILGFFPSYSNPDPKELNIYDSYSPIITFTGNLWLYSLPIWFLLMIIYVIINKRKTDSKLLAYSGVGYLCGILLLFSEIIEWYAD